MGLQPIFNFIVFNDNSIASVIAEFVAALTLTLGVNGPLRIGFRLSFVTVKARVHRFIILIF